MKTLALTTLALLGGGLMPSIALAAPPQDAGASDTAADAPATDAPGDPGAEDPAGVSPASPTPTEAENEALRSRLEALESRLAELEAAQTEQAAQSAAAKSEADAAGEGPDGEFEDAGVEDEEEDGEGSTVYDPNQIALTGRKDRPQPIGFDQWTAGNAMATRVTFAFADDNLLAGPRDRSPQPGFNLAADELFFENLTQEKRGYETETQLVVYKRMPSFFRRMDAEAALVIELQNWINEKTYRNETQIGDDGSYLKLNWYTKRDDHTGDKVSLTMFPMDSQRFLLGYTFDITWGGERIFPNNSGQVPGARLKYDWNTGTGRDSYVFAGAKTARLINDEINEPQTYYGVLAGMGLGLTDWFLWEVNGGYFQRGAFPPQGANFPGIGGKTAQAFGGSTRFTFRQGMPVGSSIDFRLFKYSPDATLLLTQPQLYDDKFAWSIGLEYTLVGQTLLDWEQPNKTKIQPAMAAAMLSRFRYKKFRVSPNIVFRDLSYVVFNIPGLAPYKAFPEEADIRPEFFGALTVDYYFDKPRLTPGVVFAYKRPSTYTSGGTTTVIRDEDDWETLPSGAGAFDILASKLTLKWDVAPFFVIISELRYTLDKNRTKYVPTAGESGRERVFDDPNVTNRLGFFLLAQARW